MTTVLIYTTFGPAQFYDCLYQVQKKQQTNYSSFAATNVIDTRTWEIDVLSRFPKIVKFCELTVKIQLTEYGHTVTER